MIWLQSNEDFNKIAKLDTRLMIITECNKDEKSNKDIKTKGFYSKFDDFYFAIYGLKNCMYLFVEKKIFKIKDEEIIKVTGPRNMRNLKIVKNDQIIFDFIYSLEGFEQVIDEDPTPFIGDEDFDIGLLASNISKDKNRKQIFTDT